jgi:hypothetical protein
MYFTSSYEQYVSSFPHKFKIFNEEIAFITTQPSWEKMWLTSKFQHARNTLFSHSEDNPQSSEYSLPCL